MFDIGWSELLVIGVVALIVVGPKDLPRMFHTLGRFTAKAKSMAREFSRAMEDAANEAGVKDVASDLKEATSAKSLGLDKLEDAVSNFEKWDPMANDADGTRPGKGPATKALSEERAAAKAAEGGQPAKAKTKPAKPASKPKAKPKAKPGTRATKPAAKPKAAKASPAAKPKSAKPKTSKKALK